MNNPFLNRYEEITYEKLQAVCKPQNAHVFSKVRLADIFPINNSGLSDNDFRFSLQAHTDFLVTNSDYESQFCVEFDGPSHKEPKQIKRDNQKNALFDYFQKPLLRINSKYLEPKYRGFDLLTYFVEIWFLNKSFYEAQKCGQDPFDEIFDPASIIHDGKYQFPYWLSLDQQVNIRKLYEQRKVFQPCSSDLVCVDSYGNYRCISWILLEANTVAYVKTGMHSQRFNAVVPSELLTMIATFDLYEELKKTLAGKMDAHDLSDLKQELDFCYLNYKSCLFSGYGEDGL